TDMSLLRVAQLSGGKWISRHNTGTTGSAGTAGSVCSEQVNPFPAATSYFTLAAAAIQNALTIIPAGAAARPVPAAMGITGFDLQMVQNPSASSARLLVKASRGTELKITLFNMQGAQLKSFRLYTTAGNTWATIDLTALPAGMYVFTARDVKGAGMVRPFVKQ
ncbi:MAG TPA: T9SS type A sorting domain-containing protein, partial [Chitinophagaceae bacterium]|nr:T9SS type A sorting domain-containing protein [Chitinophagaceae bacterium]